MSDTPNEGANGATETPATEAEKATRERRSFPVRLLRTWDLVPGASFDKIEQAEAWMREHGDDGASYMMARIIDVKKVPPRRLESVPWDK